MAYMEAQEAAEKLQQFGAIGPVDSPVSRRPKPAASPSDKTPVVTASVMDGPLTQAPQVMMLEAINALLVNATEAQHAQIQSLLHHMDIEAHREAIPYEIYFLENQEPERLAEVLGRLVQETITDADGKIEKIVPKTEDEVAIIPDAGTFSLIVHASRKNQDWIASLIERLDKRRPQVLIDVTLVEITEQDAFSYDLNLIQSFPDLTATSGLTNTIVPGDPPLTSDDILDKLAASGRSQFADYQSKGGNLRGFYGDKHINLLIEAMQSKNYGRVLAKPKILVNDNEPGSIRTADTTYVEKRSSIPVSSGGAGNNVTLIETAVDFQSYEAGITLNITPHISSGDLLRLGIELTRSDFRETESEEKPPDTTSSELKTTVFVPDGSTIILGGLLKLNQNKGGTKVPILGDIPLVGGLFRTINNKDMQSKLYIFVKAEIIRPAGVAGQDMADLEAISERNRMAFEKHEQEFQAYENWPGIKPKPVEPRKVLEAQ
jgi:general secretion pathway protein D